MLTLPLGKKVLLQRERCLYVQSLYRDDAKPGASLVDGPDRALRLVSSERVPVGAVDPVGYHCP